MNFLVAQMISCYNPFETKERNLIKIYPFETKERNLIKIYSFEKGIHMKAISKMKSLILKYRHAWVLLYADLYAMVLLPGKASDNPLSHPLTTG